MNYEQKYKEALERARVYHMGGSISAHIAEVIFPELKESEGEMIRKGIIALIEFGLDDKSAIAPGYNITKEEAIAWLEKQRDYDRLIEEMKKRKELLSKEKEKATSANDKLSLGGRIAMLQELLAFNICNTADKIEPKFKVGDWVVRGKSIVQISDIQGQYYIGIDIYGNDLTLRSDKIRLWTINDAKDGDVLVTGVDKNPFIFKGLLDSNHPNCPVAYCGIDPEGYFCVSLEKYWWTGDKDDVQPATKEQRDLLFQKMKEAGYEWDAEKKELKKIVDKSSWSEQDERNLKGVIDEIEANKNSAPDCDLATHDRFLSCLKSLRQRIGV